METMRSLTRTNSGRTRSLSSMVFDGMYFSFSLAIWGLVAAVFASIPYYALRYAPQNSLNVDFRANETVLNDYEIFRRDCDKFFLVKFVEFEFLRGNWVYEIASIAGTFFPLLYLKWPLSKCLMLIGSQFLFFSICVGFFFLSSNENLRRVAPIMLLQINVIPIAVLKFLLPRDCLIPNKLLGMMVVGGMTQIALMTVAWIRVSAGEIVLLLLVIPVARVFTTGCARLVAQALMTDKHILGQSVDVRREFAWIFLLGIQCFFAIWTRMLVTRINDWGQYALFLVASSVEEVVLRLTVSRQDNLLSAIPRFFCRLGAISKRMSVISPFQPTKTVSSMDVENGLSKRQEVKDEWLSIVVTGEMIAEHIGLFVNLFRMLMFHDAILMLPLPAFSIEDKPFDEPMPINTWVAFCLLQTFTELLVDASCLIMEERSFNFPVKRFWDSKSFAFKLINIVLAAIFATGLSTSFLFEDAGGYLHTGSCETLDICSCGPTVDTIYGQYCSRQFPNTNETFFP